MTPRILYSLSVFILFSFFERDRLPFHTFITQIPEGCLKMLHVLQVKYYNPLKGYSIVHNSITGIRQIHQATANSLQIIKELKPQNCQIIKLQVYAQPFKICTAIKLTHSKKKMHGKLANGILRLSDWQQSQSWITL